MSGVQQVATEHRKKPREGRDDFAVWHRVSNLWDIVSHLWDAVCDLWQRSRAF